MKTELTMNMKERREQLNEIYQKLLEVGFGDGSLDESLKYIDENVMGYGTALDEKIMSYNDFRDLIIVQRNQAANFDDFIYQSNPVINRLFNEGNSALIVDEIDLTSVINGENKMMTVRMSTMLEFNKETWKVVHWHGSIADHVSDGEDPWHVEEWKQKTEKLERMVEEKTAELIRKNSELEIEAALERVRSIAMGMRKSDDLLNICEVSYNEFEKLGFDNLRAVLIHILDDEKRTFADYDYCDLFGGEISTLSYDSHPVVVNYFNQIRSSKDAFAEAVFTGEELESWKKVRLETGQKNDPRLNNANALYYYGYSIGIGDFTISTLKPIDEYKRKILKRFRNVFDLAYRRFTDITKAEEQAREAKIEAALERVRGSALAMHSSEDLAITIDHFFHELKNLNIQLIRCGVGIKNKDSRIVDVTVTSATESGEDIKLTGKLKLSGHPILDKVYEALQLQAEYFPVLHGDEINEYYRTMNPDIEFPNFSEDDVQYGYYFNFQEGGVFVWTEKELFEKEINIFRRFKSVLSLTYRRYMDLKEAEAQAREAQIELSLERVRARNMAMQKSDELSNTASLMFKEIVELGVNLWSCGFNIIDHEKKLITQWVSSGDGRILPPFETPATDDIFMRFYEGSKLGESLYIEEMGGQQLVDHYKYMTSLPQVLDIVSELDNAGIELPKFQIMHAAYFKQGYLLFITYKAVPDFHNIFGRFAKVFEQTYTRFLDLQKAEAQTREAQIEAALERVRSRSMAMHKSDELADLSLELVKQVHALGVDTWFCAFNIYDDDQQGSLEWGSNGQGTFPQYRTPREGIFLRYYEAGQRGEKLFVNEINEKNVPLITNIYAVCRVWGEQLLKMKGAGIPFPTSQIDHVAYFKYGYIIFITFEPALEAHDIFKRFAGVFEQTYTRFLDLQKSEEQRKIIQAENDRKTEELEEARQLQLAMLPKELPKLAKLDIAVYMQTATEVGGDYYDFSTKDDGSLNVCLGDATGHGLKAGTLVSMMKSLFIADSVRLDIKKFFTSSNDTLKKMSLSQMMMAFAMINIYGNKIKIANAGIPPVYIYRKNEHSVEEVNLNGLPIGAMKNFKYDVYESKVETGDVILIMSDGMPELQNKENEMYGYDRLKKVFTENAEKNSHDIISAFNSESITWSGDKEPDDDITFVVIKVK